MVGKETDGLLRAPDAAWEGYLIDDITLLLPSFSFSSSACFLPRTHTHICKHCICPVTLWFISSTFLPLSFLHTLLSQEANKPYGSCESGKQLLLCEQQHHVVQMSFLRWLKMSWLLAFSQTAVKLTFYLYVFGFCAWSQLKMCNRISLAACFESGLSLHFGSPCRRYHLIHGLPATPEKPQKMSLIN